MCATTAMLAGGVLLALCYRSCVFHETEVRILEVFLPRAHVSVSFVHTCHFPFQLMPGVGRCATRQPPRSERALVASKDTSPPCNLTHTHTHPLPPNEPYESYCGGMVIQINSELQCRWSLDHLDVIENKHSRPFCSANSIFLSCILSGNANKSWINASANHSAQNGSSWAESAAGLSPKTLQWVSVFCSCGSFFKKKMFFLRMFFVLLEALK